LVKGNKENYYYFLLLVKGNKENYYYYFGKGNMENNCSFLRKKKENYVWSNTQTKINIF